MQIDRTHHPWIVATLVVLGVATAAYIPYASHSPHGPQGGSWPGLIYGFAGYGLMLFAGLLGLRTKLPVWRLGRASTWMRGHLWLGLLSIPLVLFHAGFGLGGTLSSVLMVLTLIVGLSGIGGAVLQHYLPRVMTQQVPMETVFEQIDAVRAQLLKEAGWILNSLDSRKPDPITLLPAQDDQALARALEWAARLDAKGVAPADDHSTVLLVQTAPAGIDSLRTFVELDVLPFLERPRERHAMGVAAQARERFHQIRTLTPPELHDAVKDLESICEEARQLNRQEKLHHLLHGWLLVHIPLSYAVLLLGAWHGLMALRY